MSGVQNSTSLTVSKGDSSWLVTFQKRKQTGLKLYYAVVIKEFASNVPEIRVANSAQINLMPEHSTVGNSMKSHNKIRRWTPGGTASTGGPIDLNSNAQGQGWWFTDPFPANQTQPFNWKHWTKGISTTDNNSWIFMRLEIRTYREGDADGPDENTRTDAGDEIYSLEVTGENPSYFKLTKTCQYPESSYTGNYHIKSAGQGGPINEPAYPSVDPAYGTYKNPDDRGPTSGGKFQKREGDPGATDFLETMECQDGGSCYYIAYLPKHGSANYGKPTTGQYVTLNLSPKGASPLNIRECYMVGPEISHADWLDSHNTAAKPWSGQNNADAKDYCYTKQEVADCAPHAQLVDTTDGDWKNLISDNFTYFIKPGTYQQKSSTSCRDCVKPEKYLRFSKEAQTFGRLLGMDRFAETYYGGVMATFNSWDPNSDGDYDPDEIMFTQSVTAAFVDKQEHTLADEGATGSISTGKLGLDISQASVDEGKRVFLDRTNIFAEFGITRATAFNVLKTMKAALLVSAGANNEADTLGAMNYPAYSPGVSGGNGANEIQPGGQLRERNPADPETTIQNHLGGSATQWTQKQYEQFQMFVEKVVNTSASGTIGIDVNEIFSMTTTLSFSKTEGASLNDALGQKNWESTSMSLTGGISLKGLFDFWVAPVGNEVAGSDEERAFDDNFTMSLSLGSVSTSKMTVRQWKLNTLQDGSVEIDKTVWDEHVGETFTENTIGELTGMSMNYSATFFNGWNLNISSGLSATPGEPISISDVFDDEIVKNATVTLSGNPKSKLRWTASYDQNGVALGIAGQVALIKSVDKAASGEDANDGNGLPRRASGTLGPNLIETGMDMDMFFDIGAVVTDGPNGREFGVKHSISGQIAGFNYAINTQDGSGSIGKTWQPKFAQSWKRFFRGEDETISLDFSFRAEKGPVTNPYFGINLGADFMFRKTVAEFTDVMGKLQWFTHITAGVRVGGPPSAQLQSQGVNMGFAAISGITWNNNILEWCGLPFNIHPGFSTVAAASFHFGGYTRTVRDARGIQADGIPTKSNFVFTFHVGGVSWKLAGVNNFRKHVKRKHDSIFSFLGLGSCPALKNLGPKEDVWEYLIRVAPIASIDKLTEASRRCADKRDKIWNDKYQDIVNLNVNNFQQGTAATPGGQYADKSPAKCDCGSKVYRSYCAERDEDNRSICTERKTVKVSNIYGLKAGDDDPWDDGAKTVTFTSSDPKKQKGQELYKFIYQNGIVPPRRVLINGVNQDNPAYWKADTWPCLVTHAQATELVNEWMRVNHDPNWDRCECLKTEFHKLTHDKYYDSPWDNHFGYDIATWEPELTGSGGNGEDEIRGYITIGLEQLDNLVLNWFMKGKDPTGDGNAKEFADDLENLFNSVLAQAGYDSGDISRIVKDEIQEHWRPSDFWGGWTFGGIVKTIVNTLKVWEWVNLCKWAGDALQAPFKLISKIGGSNSHNPLYAAASVCGMGENLNTDDCYNYYLKFEHYREKYANIISHYYDVTQFAKTFYVRSVANYWDDINPNTTSNALPYGSNQLSTAPNNSAGCVSAGGRTSALTNPDVEKLIQAIQIMEGKPLTWFSGNEYNPEAPLRGITDADGLVEKGPSRGRIINSKQFGQESYDYLAGTAAWNSLNVDILAGSSSACKRGYFDGTESDLAAWGVDVEPEPPLTATNTYQSHYFTAVKECKTGNTCFNALGNPDPDCSPCTYSSKGVTGKTNYKHLKYWADHLKNSTRTNNSAISTHVIEKLSHPNAADDGAAAKEFWDSTTARQDLLSKYGTLKTSLQGFFPLADGDLNSVKAATNALAAFSKAIDDYQLSSTPSRAKHTIAVSDNYPPAYGAAGFSYYYYDTLDNEWERGAYKNLLKVREMASNYIRAVIKKFMCEKYFYIWHHYYYSTQGNNNSNRKIYIVDEQIAGGAASSHLAYIGAGDDFFQATPSIHGGTSYKKDGADKGTLFINSDVSFALLGMLNKMGLVQYANNDKSAAASYADADIMRIPSLNWLLQGGKFSWSTMEKTVNLSGAETGTWGDSNLAAAFVSRFLDRGQDSASVRSAMDYTGDKGRVTQPNANRYRFNNGTLIVGSTTSSGLPGAPWNSGIPEAPISGATPWWDKLNTNLNGTGLPGAGARFMRSFGSFYYHLLQSAENAGFKGGSNYSACDYLEFLDEDLGVRLGRGTIATLTVPNTNEWISKFIYGLDGQGSSINHPHFILSTILGLRGGNLKEPLPPSFEPM